MAEIRDLIEAQGGDVSAIDQPERLPAAATVEILPAPRAGWLSEINARVIGETSVLLGAGRQRKSDLIDHGVGILVHAKVGDRVEAGQPLFSLHARSRAEAQDAGRQLLDACAWSDVPVEPLPLFYDVVA